jgi:hypothetical protein
MRFLVNLIFLFVIPLIWGQGKLSNNALMSLSFNHGFVIPEYSNITYSANQPIFSTQAAWIKRTTGKKLVEQLYRFPEYGFSLSYTSLGNPSVFGHEVALYPFFRTFFVRNKRSAFYHQFGFGLGYASKKFNLVSNPDNISVGSHLNMHFDYQLGYRYSLNETWGLETSLRFAHFSNANMAEPNLGLNLLYANLGIVHSFGKQDPIQRSAIPSVVHAHEFAFIYAAGGKHTRALQSKVYFTSSMSLEYKYHAFHKFHFGAGADVFFDASTETELSINPNSTYHSIDNFSSGVHLSQEIVFDRFSFILQEGFHLGLKDKVHTSPMYNRAIIRWKINDHFLLHVSMKSHLHILDYPELGFGYYIKSKS